MGCRNVISLVGKVLTKKPINRSILKAAMEMIRRQPMSFKFQEHGERRDVSNFSLTKSLSC